MEAEKDSKKKTNNYNNNNTIPTAQLSRPCITTKVLSAEQCSIAQDKFLDHFAKKYKDNEHFKSVYDKICEQKLLKPVQPPAKE
jgi:hypothetical protein